MRTRDITAVVRSRGFLPWALATVGSRLPVAMAPLALVLVALQATGSYGAGGILVAAHTVGEIIGSPLMGRLADAWPARSALALCLALQGAGFALMAWSLNSHHLSAAVVLGGLVGVIAAGVPGALRSRLTRLVPAPAVVSALSIDSALNQLCWGAAPVIIAALATGADRAMLLPAVAMPAFAAALACIFLGPFVRLDEPHRASGGFAPLLQPLRITLMLSAILRLSLGVLAVAAVPAFTQTGHPGIAVIALGAYAAATGLGAVTVGSRRPPHRDAQSDAAVLLVSLAIVLISAGLFAGNAFSLVVIFVLAGFIEGPTVTALSFHIQQSVQPDRRATAFSLQYAALGVGFALGSLVLGPSLKLTSPAGAVSAIGAIILTVAAIVLMIRQRSLRSSSTHGHTDAHF